MRHRTAPSAPTVTLRTGVEALDTFRLGRLLVRYGHICGASGHPPELRTYACRLAAHIADVLRLRGEGAA